MTTLMNRISQRESTSDDRSVQTQNDDLTQRVLNRSAKEKMMKLKNVDCRKKAVSICDRASVQSSESCPRGGPALGNLQRILVRHIVAKEQLVVQRYTDPDLTSVRSEAPSIARLGRQTLLQACASPHWNLYKGDVNTALLHGKQRS